MLSVQDSNFLQGKADTHDFLALNCMCHLRKLSELSSLQGTCSPGNTLDIYFVRPHYTHHSDKLLVHWCLRHSSCPLGRSSTCWNLQLRKSPDRTGLVLKHLSSSSVHLDNLRTNVHFQGCTFPRYRSMQTWSQQCRSDPPGKRYMSVSLSHCSSPASKYLALSYPQHTNTQPGNECTFPSPLRCNIHLSILFTQSSPQGNSSPHHKSYTRAIPPH